MSIYQFLLKVGNKNKFNLYIKYYINYWIILDVLRVNLAGVKKYIQSGQDLNVQNRDGQTALMIGRIFNYYIYILIKFSTLIL